MFCSFNNFEMDTRTAISESNDLSNGSSSICYFANNETLTSEPLVTEIEACRRLSENLESIFESRDFGFFADARIIVFDGHEVPVHRCILSARSSFFRNVFSHATERGVKLELKELANDFTIGLDALIAVLTYMYSGKVKPLLKDACVCIDEECSHAACRPAIDFVVEMLYASFIFQISELVSLYQRHLLDILEKVAIDDILVIILVANICGSASRNLLARSIELTIKSDIDTFTLEKALPQHIVKQITDSRLDLGLERPEGKYFPDKHVQRIHRALDSDDVELVRMLLTEGHTTLDDAYALHYAVAYCDKKTTTELLDLGIADVNRRNARGYTVLHIAAIRKEPTLIVSLLTKGARPSDLMLDGRKALQISKRLTRAADYYKLTEEGKVTPTERLCVEILEQAERRDPILGEASFSLSMAGDDLRMKLLYLENRVALAKLLFPMEAKVAMEIAQVDGTSEFKLVSMDSRAVDLNEAPFKIQEEHLVRMRALSRTVELGKRFFPRCSEVLNKIMDTDDLSELACLSNDSIEERLLKRKRHMELQELLIRAFSEDKEEFDRSGISSSSSSTSLEVVGHQYHPRKLIKR